MQGIEPKTKTFPGHRQRSRCAAGGMTALSGRNGGSLNRQVRRAGCVARNFWLARRASVAIETTLAISLVVISLGGLMEIVSAVYLNDYMARAARAGARAVALVPGSVGSSAALRSVACDGIKIELRLEEDFDCAQSWTLTVDTRLTTENLRDGESPDPIARAGDMVRVQIGWYREAWTFGAEPDDLDDPDDPEDPENQQQEPPEVAVGVARTEPQSLG